MKMPVINTVKELEDFITYTIRESHVEFEDGSAIGFPYKEDELRLYRTSDDQEGEIADEYTLIKWFNSHKDTITNI